MTIQVYILESTATGKNPSSYKPTYVGATVGLERRLRQHNGEIAGGARRTTAYRSATNSQTAQKAWRVAATVTGFRTWSEALKFEYALRRVGRRHVRRWDLHGRRLALEHLMGMERWSSTSPPASEVPLEVCWDP